MDFGIIIDTTVIVIENIHRHLMSGEAPHESTRSSILRAAQEVGGPMFFSTHHIRNRLSAAVHDAWSGGRDLLPMSRTYAYALGAAILLAVTLSPVLASFVVSKDMGECPNPIWRLIQRIYHRLFMGVLSWPRLTLAVMLVVIVSALSLFPRLGGEFLPKLEEGNLWITATMPLTISLQDGDRLANRMRRVMRSFPEVDTVVSQMGRPDSGTETTGFFNVEFSVELKNESRWPVGMIKAELVKLIEGRLSAAVPGVNFDYSQNIEANINEALSGVKGPTRSRCSVPTWPPMRRSPTRLWG